MSKKDFTSLPVCERLKAVRTMARLSRGYIQQQYGLSAATLKAWENGLIKITAKGLERCIAIYRQEGIIVTQRWLLTGIGLPPEISLALGGYLANEDYPLNPIRTKLEVNEEGRAIKNFVAADIANILKEVDYFKSLDNKAVTLMVTDDYMSPVYQPGDYVGGYWRAKEDLLVVVAKDCIVRLPDGTEILRRVFKAKSGKGYNLACINPIPMAPEPIIFNVEITHAAPIIWHRIPNGFKLI